jgi:hypothetical protein
MYLPAAITKQTEIDSAVAEVAGILAPDVVYIRYEIGQDWSGDWAIYFRVILSDEAGQKKLRQVAKEVVRLLADRLDFPLLGVFPYHNISSATEQAEIQVNAVR